MQGKVGQPKIFVRKSIGGQHGYAVIFLRGKAPRPPHRQGWQKGALLGLRLWLAKGRAASAQARGCHAGGDVVGLGRAVWQVELLRRKFMPWIYVRPYVARNKVVQTFGVGSPRPRAEVKPMLGVGVGEGKPSATAKTQIIAPAFHPLAHGLAPRRGEGSGLEAGIATGNQQQRHARAALMLAAIGGCAPRLA